MTQVPITMTHASGIHHITALARNAKDNVDFYTRVLGLRKVKLSVNQDDTETYHLYYGDTTGSPGTALTFFPHPQARQARPGKGLATEIRFEIAKSSIGFWMDRLATLNIPADRTENAFDSHVIRFHAPDQIALELVGVDTPALNTPWATDDIPAEHALRGFHSTLIWADGRVDDTIALLSDVFDFSHTETKGNVTRLRTGRDGLGQIVDVYHDPDTSTQAHRGLMGAGAIHHIAFRAADDAHEQRLRTTLAEQSFDVTPVIDRYYFRSVYFREPSGVIFEIATDEPGFTVDEPLDTLGTELKLPPHLENKRAEIESKLAPL